MSLNHFDWHIGNKKRRRRRTGQDEEITANMFACLEYAWPVEVEYAVEDLPILAPLSFEKIPGPKVSRQKTNRQFIINKAELLANKNAKRSANCINST